MAGASVQFYGIDNVMQAADNLKCSCWGIYINGRLFSKYEDTDVAAALSLLRDNLEILERSNSNGTYTLKFFELQKGQPPKINDRSVTDAGSFNFKLIDAEEREQGLQRVNSYNIYIRQMEERMKKLEDELKATEVEPEPDTIGSVILDLFKRPDDLAVVVNTMRAAVGLPVQNLGMITGIRAGNTESISQDEKLQRTADAIDKLEKNDPDLVHHLEKLSKIAEESPDQFKMLLSMLGK